MRIAIYCRISRDGEGGGLGVARQEQDCRAYCAKRGWKDITVFTDNNITGMGGKKRPDYERMLAGLKAGEFGAVVTWHLDRMTRSPKDLETLIDIIGDADSVKVEVQSLNGGVVDLASPEGRLNVRIMANISRYYVEHNRKNLLRAMESGREKGMRHGGTIPYGWVRTGPKQIAPVEAEVPHVRKAFEMCLAGETYKAIADYLNANSQVTRKGNPWNHDSAMRLVNQATHAGLIEHMPDNKAGYQYCGKATGEIVVGDWEGIVSRETWEAARARTADPTRWNRTVGRPAPATLLARIMKCGVCGGVMGTHSRRESKRRKAQPPSYICANSHSSIRVTKADDYVVPEILGIIRQSRDAKALARTTAEIDRIEIKLAEVAEMYREDEINKTQLYTISKPLRERRNAMLHRIEVINLPSNVGTREWWDELSLDEQRNVISGTALVVLSRGKGGHKAVDLRITVTEL